MIVCLVLRHRIPELCRGLLREYNSLDVLDPALAAREKKFISKIGSVMGVTDHGEVAGSVAWIVVKSSRSVVSPVFCKLLFAFVLVGFLYFKCFFCV